MDLPTSLSRDISPPRAPKRRKTSEAPQFSLPGELSTPLAEPCYDAANDPTLAAVEAGRAKIEDHLTYFQHHLAKVSRITPSFVPRLSINDFTSLYKNNQHEHGHHFVIHQHNHPKAGVHYDLRLQFSATSSVSWAFPKGLPGDPNSRRPGRMAVETRVHNLWNNLIESASVKTGSLLIWDTGTYRVLTQKKGVKEMPSPQTTDDESEMEDVKIRNSEPENDKLVSAFKSRHIRLRLHGTRFPKNYTITLRLPPNNDITKKPAARRRSSRPMARSRRPSYTSDSDSDSNSDSALISLRTSSASTVNHDKENVDDDNLDTDSEEDTLTRTRNAYPGSTNSIGSVHQRRWFALLDKQSSGFESNGGKWIRRTMPDGELGGFEPFVVRGRDHERSIVTGRLARDVENDEGCEGYIGRGAWRSIED